jgi:2-amino-4-hydroxy-6-hydroxymethyldihydropteridine diphosphokinase
VARVYVSIGSNIDRDRNIALALRLLEASFGRLQRSSVYESAAVGFDSDPFYNLVVGFETAATPRHIQDALHCIEESSGRIRTTGLSARTLDLDLLLYDDLVIDADGLTLPRGDITRYAFVLGPLAEIAGGQRHPVTGDRYADMWSAFDDPGQILSRVDWPPADPEHP